MKKDIETYIVEHRRLLIYPVYQNTEKQHAYMYTKQMYTDKYQSQFAKIWYLVIDLAFPWKLVINFKF